MNYLFPRSFWDFIHHRAPRFVVRRDQHRSAAPPTDLFIYFKLTDNFDMNQKSKKTKKREREREGENKKKNFVETQLKATCQLSNQGSSRRRRLSKHLCQVNRFVVITVVARFIWETDENKQRKWWKIPGTRSVLNGKTKSFSSVTQSTQSCHRVY